MVRSLRLADCGGQTCRLVMLSEMAQFAQVMVGIAVWHPPRGHHLCNQRYRVEQGTHEVHLATTENQAALHGGANAFDALSIINCAEKR
jgi:hypothetical protein